MNETVRSRRAEGFTLLELLVVVTIMFVMAAMMLPRIASYFRNYQIRNATQAVGSEISAARNKAIMKNVNFGVVFQIESADTYRYVIEDDQTPPRLSRRLLPGEILPPGTDPLRVPQVGPLRQLPEGIRFATSCTGFAASGDNAFRFNRMGMWCDPTATAPGNATCPPWTPTGAPNLVMNAVGAGARICLEQPSTGLRREVRVGPGGRVLQEDRQR